MLGQPVQQNVHYERESVGQQHVLRVDLVVGGGPDQDLACRHQALERDDAGVAAPALRQHEVDLLQCVEPAQASEHILVFGGVLLKCSTDLTKCSLQGAN